MLYHHLLPSGVKFIGFWLLEGYEFTSPKPLTDDGKHFVGLALDEVNQFEESDENVYLMVYNANFTRNRRKLVNHQSIYCSGLSTAQR